MQRGRTPSESLCPVPTANNYWWRPPGPTVPPADTIAIWPDQTAPGPTKRGSATIQEWRAAGRL